MARKFEELASRTKSGWSDNGHRVYDAATDAFKSEMDDRADLGMVIAQARKQRHLSQLALAQLSGIQQAEISKIERGISNPTTATLMKITAPLGLRLTVSPK